MHFNPRVSVLKWNQFWQNCDVLSDNWSKWTLDYWSLHDFQHVCVLVFYYIWSILGSTLLGLGFGVLYFFWCLICFVQEFLDFCVFLVFNLIFSFGFVFFFLLLGQTKILVSDYGRTKNVESNLGQGLRPCWFAMFFC